MLPSIVRRIGLELADVASVVAGSVSTIAASALDLPWRLRSQREIVGEAERVQDLDRLARLPERAILGCCAAWKIDPVTG